MNSGSINGMVGLRGAGFLRPTSPVQRAAALGAAMQRTTPVQSAKAERNSQPSSWLRLVKTELVTKHSLESLLAQRQAATDLTMPATAIARLLGRGRLIDARA